MSSKNIRSAFNSPCARAVQYIASAVVELARDPKNGADMSTLAEKIKRVIKTINTNLDKWTEFTKTLEGDALDTEETTMENFRSSGHHPTALVDLLEEKLMELELALEAIVFANPPPQQQQAAQAAPVQYLPLPKPILLTFDGNNKEWAAFWQNFEDNVHKNTTLSDAQRLSYLIGQLRGPAKEMTGGYRLINESYKPVVEALKNRYGDEEKVAEELQQEFINLPRATMAPSSLRSLLESVERICRQLTAGTPEDVLHGFVDSPFFIATLKDKLPRDLKLTLISREGSEGTEEKPKWTAKEWRSNFAKHVKYAEEAQHVDKSKLFEPKNGYHNHKNGHNSSKLENNNQIKRAFPVSNQNQKGKKNPYCILCETAGHWPLFCPNYDTALKRKDKLDELKRCINCLSPDHLLRDCKNNRNCPVCDKKHNKIVCFKFKQNESLKSQNNNSKSWNNKNGKGGKIQNGPPKNGSNSTPLFLNQTSGNTPTNNGCFSVFRAIKSQSFLMVGHVPIWTGNGTELVPVFFDTGSQSSFITNSLARKIGCRKLGHQDLCVGGFVGNNPSAPQSLRSSIFKIMMKKTDGCWEEIYLAGIEKITPEIDALNGPMEFFDYENGEDDLKYGRIEPKIMIGIREFWKFFLSKTEIRSGIYKISTVFGDVYCGEDETNAFCGALTNFCGPILDFPQRKDPIENLWNLETLGIRDCPLENDDEKGMLIFQKSLTKDKNGRIEVSWPWKSEKRPPDNFNLAFSRLTQLLPKLRANPQLHQGYEEIFEDYLKKGIIAISNRNGCDEHFLPHHPVLGRKLRIVYAADAHIKGQPSLNDCLLTGPNLIPDLAEILIRFRSTKIPVLADVQQAFLTLSLAESDREFVKFLWLRDINRPISGENLIVYKFCRVPFGIVSSPFLLNATTREFLESNSDSRVQKFAKNLFVDNLLTGGENIEEANEMALKAKSIFSKAQMNLRDFISNKNEALIGLEKEDHLDADRSNCPVLGLKWDINNELLKFKLPEPEPTEFDTRRTVLSAKSLMFEPLGLCSPLMIESKLFFQNIWGKTRNWDQKLEDSDQKIWNDILERWKGKTIKIPRLTNLDRKGEIQIHAFTDASPDAFCTAIYAVSGKNGNKMASLIYARSRLRPKKMGENPDGMTIPRLELLGVLIGIRAKSFVKKALELPIDSPEFLWTDSQIVLNWLKSTDKKPVFVENRIREIRTHRETSFRYVPRIFNPADIGTRPISPEELENNILWFKGPEWLIESEDTWPNELVANLPPDESPEPKLDLIGVTVAVESGPIEFSRFSNWWRLVRCAAYLLRFLSLKFGKIHKMVIKIPELKEISLKGEFNSIDLKMSKIFLLKLIQREIPPGDAYLIIDGLLRLKSRLEEADVPLDFKHPIILPSNSWPTKLIIREIHQKMMHSGPEATLNEFLMNYWCKNARKLVKREIKNCPKCIKDKATRFSLPPMPNLPKKRVEFSPAFTNVGVDYLGPSLFKRPNEPPGNFWVILFTCLCCRAVHLELVQTLEANDFLLAFRRFVARRGVPKEILSDNGTQLVLSKKALAEANIPTQWKLITALAPWEGGVYERLMALVKQCFRRSLGQKMLNWVELETFIVEIEGIINSRPITYVDQDGRVALRPIDFLVPKIELAMENQMELEEIYRANPAQKLAQRWKATEVAINKFKERWAREYLVMLRERNNTQHKGPRLQSNLMPKIGQIVLIQEDFYPKNLWPIGRIIELKGPKNHARSAGILMPNGRTWFRPVNLLAPLEVPLEENNKLTENEPDPILEAANQQPDEFIEELAIEPEKAAEKPEKLNGTHRTRFKTGNLKPSKRFANDQWAIPVLNINKFIGLNFMVLLCFISFLPLSMAKKPALICIKEGIEFLASGETKNVKLCCDGICGSRPYKEPSIWQLPKENLIIGYQCEGTYWESLNQSTHIENTCSPVNICDLIDCIFCWSQILNPSCSPAISAALIGGIILICIFFLLFLFCLLTCCYLWRIVNPFRCPSSHRWANPFCCLFLLCRNWKRKMPVLSQKRMGRRKRNKEPSESEENEIFIPQNNYKKNKPKPKTKLGWYLSSLTIFTLLIPILPLAQGSVETISLTSATEECEVGAENTTCSFNWVTQMTLLPAGQVVRQILKDPQSNFAGIFSIQLKGVTQKCKGETLGWLRSYKIETLSTKRCPGMGACKGNFCKDLLPNGTIQEFHEGRDKPGNSFCIESTGFWLNGCASPHSACLFYRNYIVPTTPRGTAVFEYFYCPNWDFYISAEISLELIGREIIKEELDLYNGYTFHWRGANLSLTPIITGRPSMPILGSKFISNGYGAALVPDLPLDLDCPLEIDADLMLENCRLSIESCPFCRPDHDSGTVRCHCRELNLEKYMEDQNTKLPLPQGVLNLDYVDGDILARTPYIPVMVMAKMEGMRLITQNIRSTCKLEPLSLLGCYKCTTGGRFDYQCTSTFGTVMAEVNCENGITFIAHCSQNGTFDHAILPFEKSSIDTKCTVKCRAGDTLFSLKGKLNFIPRKSNELGISGKEIFSNAENYGNILTNMAYNLINLDIKLIGMIISIVLFGLILAYFIIKCNPFFRGYRALARFILILSLFGSVKSEIELYEAAMKEAELEKTVSLEKGIVIVPLLVLSLILLIIAFLLFFGFFDWLKRKINDQNRAGRIANRTRLVMRPATLPGEMEECSICFDPLEGLSRELACNHSFHKICIDQWLAKESTCPLCRLDIGLDLV